MAEHEGQDRRQARGRCSSFKDSQWQVHIHEPKLHVPKIMITSI
jgi:hypothetical protein